MPEKHITPRRAPFPLNTETYAGFEQAFKGASERSQMSVDALRSSVSTCVAELKRAGLGPETVLVTMKSCVRHFGEKHFRRMGWDPQSAIANLSHQIISWCIEDYYSRQ